MKLTYRGIHYTYSPSATDIDTIPISSETASQYRGATFSIKQHKRSAKSPLAVNLQYRGDLYYPKLHRSIYPASEMA